ncbi:MAG TPA: cation diffusion facilitator family transporter [Steroidobacteraceae bacterium]|jgi:ferrous-iron efflux pump FieF|nr:cation diffusion facilitator family transporter [Steroidobacteraceae bacterium]
MKNHSDAFLRRLASGIVLGAAIVLIVAKLWGWMATDSVALLTSAADAVVDALAATATFFGVRFAQHPADLEHRFGHGKGEALAAFAQAILLSGTAAVLAAQSFWRLLYPQQLTDITLGMWIAAGGLAIASLLAAMQSWVVRRTGSTAIAADRAHYLMDAFLNGAVLIALTLARATGWERVDSIAALVIAFCMIANARRVAATASGQLLDAELPQAERERIKAAAVACAGIRGVHDLRTRDAGDRVFVEFHLEVDGHVSVHEGHDMVDAAERAVAELFSKETEVMGHLEPAGIKDDRLDERVRRPR